MNGKCELCGLECELTVHHLIPVVKAKKRYHDVRNEDSNHIMICRQCHDQIHALHSESELKYEYNTLERLKNDEDLMKFVRWRQKHPEFEGHSKMSNKRKK